jgi:hypothetical protein
LIIQGVVGGPLDVAEKNTLIEQLIQLGYLDREINPTDRGKIYAKNLAKTYSFESRRDSDDTLADSFSIGKTMTRFFPSSQFGPKPIIFQYSIPDPFIDDDGKALMFHFSHELSLSAGLFDLLVFSLYDGDAYPTDFGLISRGEKSILGRTPSNLHEEVVSGDRFAYAFSNRETFAIVLDAIVEDNIFKLKLEAYFSRSEGLPYADMVMTLQYKLRAFLRLIGQETQFKSNALKGEEIIVNQYRETKQFKQYKDWYHEPLEHSLPSFRIRPVGEIRYHFPPHDPWIAMIAMLPPPFLNEVPLLGGVSPWFGYCGGGTRDEDVLKGKSLRFWHIHVLELEHIVLSTLIFNHPHS